MQITLFEVLIIILILIGVFILIKVLNMPVNFRNNEEQFRNVRKKIKEKEREESE